MSLFLIRHGETKFNVAGRFQGQNDSGLTERGVLQARANAVEIARRSGQATNLHFVSSPLGRTLKTSQLVCEVLGFPFAQVQTDDRLKEMHYGAWQGMTEFEIDQEYPGLWAARNKQPDTFKIPGDGESYNDLYHRIDDWLDETRALWDGEATWIVVSHGGTGSVIRGRYLGLTTQETRNLPRPHACIYEFKGGTISEHVTGTDHTARP